MSAGINGSAPESRTSQALRKQRRAGIERRYAANGGPSAEDQLAVACDLEQQAAALLVPLGMPHIRNGEVLATVDDSGPAYEIQNTLRNPDQAAIDASVARTDLLFTRHADITALAVDTAASVQAGNSIEKMLAHQLALAHVLLMKTGARALEFERREGRYGEGFLQQDSIELGRLNNSVARLMGAFHEAALTLQRLKTGASQTVTVRHVTVQAGAQAVIGNVGSGRRTQRRRERVAK